MSRKRTADELLGMSPPSPDDVLTGPDLVRVYWALRGREQALVREKAFWESTNEALQRAYAELAERTEQLAAARRRIAELDSRWWRFGDRAIHQETGERRGPGAAQDMLTVKELELLRYLVARAGQAVHREDLYRDVWGYAPGVISRTLDVHVRRLRQHLEADPGDPEILRTEPGVGYRLVQPPVSVESEAPVVTSNHAAPS